MKLNNGSRVVVMPDRGGVGETLTKRLRTMGVEVLQIDGTPDPDKLTTLLKHWDATRPVDGVYWLPALDQRRRYSPTGCCGLA